MLSRFRSLLVSSADKPEYTAAARDLGQGLEGAGEPVEQAGAAPLHGAHVVRHRPVVRPVGHPPAAESGQDVHSRDILYVYSLHICKEYR